MNITGNGNHPLRNNVDGFGGPNSVIYVSGNFAGAAVKLAYKDEEGTLIDLLDGELLVNTQQVVEHGYGIGLYAVVSGATGSTSINIKSVGKA